MAPEGKGLRFRCRVGFHEWYTDMAYLHQVRRCNHCPAVSDEEQARLLDLEREGWKRVSNDGGGLENIAQVKAYLKSKEKQ
jgi:hypothetical protein